MAIKKSKPQDEGAIKKREISDLPLRFSFKLFDATDAEMCPAVFKDGYTQTLMERLKSLSSWTVNQFTEQYHRTIRNHKLVWSETARPDGFAHLNAAYKDYVGWQFCLTANVHGRVHGIIIDDTFYIVWLDQDHRMYP